jgi:hypothetical protein
MNIRSKMALVAVLLFGVSFALPADGNMSGIASLNACWGVFTEFGKDHGADLGGWLYYSGFVLANALFVALVGALLLRPARTGLRFWISTVSTLQVFSWLVVNLFSLRNGDSFDLGIGYFIWLLSFIVLLAAHGIRSETPNRLADPALASGTQSSRLDSTGL